MILASQNVQIAEEKDFVREKISGIFFVNTSQKEKSRKRLFLFTLHYSLFTLHFSLISPTRLFERRDKREERKEKVAFRYGEKQFYIALSHNVCYNKIRKAVL